MNSRYVFSTLRNKKIEPPKKQPSTHSSFNQTRVLSKTLLFSTTQHQFSSQSTSKLNNSWHLIKNSSIKINPNFVSDFAQFANHTVTTKQDVPNVPPIMMDLKEVFKNMQEEPQTPYPNYVEFLRNLMNLRKYAFDHMRGLNSPFNQIPAFKEFLSMDDNGINSLMWKVYDEVEKMKDPRLAHFTKLYAGKKSKELLSILNQKLVTKNEVQSDLLKKLEIEDEIQSIRKILHPKRHKIRVVNRAIIGQKAIEKAKEMGYEANLFCQEVDQSSPIRRLADSVIDVKNLNDPEEILEAAKQHPEELLYLGYGYLSEKEKFISDCEKNNIPVVAPSSESMRAFSDKSEARKIVENLGISVVPGYGGETREDRLITKENKLVWIKRVEKIGFPIMVKCSEPGKHGGGKGNEPANNVDEFINALDRFEGEEIVLEKYLINPKHIEIQLLIDEKEIVVLGSRDCSIQRHGQKIVEIAPAEVENLPTLIDNAIKIGKKAQSMQFEGPLTVEYLGNYHNEENARIQVEHKPTEDILGNKISIIETQLDIFADGKSVNESLKSQLDKQDLPDRSYQNMSSQEIINYLRQLSPVKASVEVRVNAVNIKPNEKRDHSTKGKLTECHFPDPGKIGSIETGVEKYMDVDTNTVDKNVALVCGFGRNRPEALMNAKSLTSKIKIEGIDTNLLYLEDTFDYIMKNPNSLHIEACKEIDKVYVKRKQAQAEEKTQEEQPDHVSSLRF